MASIGAVVLVEVFNTRRVGKILWLQRNNLTGSTVSILGFTYEVLLAFLAMRDYAEIVQSIEQPSQAAGHVSSAGDQALGHADALSPALQPTDAMGTDVQAALSHEFGWIGDARALRIATGTSGLPATPGFVVIAGSTISLAFASLLGASVGAIQAVSSALLALSVTLMLVTIVVISHLFRGEVRISPTSFTAAVAAIQTQRWRNIRPIWSAKSQTRCS